MKQFGADYMESRNFQQAAINALKKIRTVYPGLDLQSEYGGLSILPSSQPSIPPKA